jgi:hypothetical protein
MWYKNSKENVEDIFIHVSTGSRFTQNGEHGGHSTELRCGVASPLSAADTTQRCWLLLLPKMHSLTLCYPPAALRTQRVAQSD